MIGNQLAIVPYAKYEKKILYLQPDKGSNITNTHLDL